MLDTLKGISKDKTEITAQNEIKKKLKHVGRIKPHKGHTLFEVNYSTGEITRAKIETLPARAGEVDPKTGNALIRKRVIVNENCTYISALNKKNAVKKFKKLISSLKTEQDATHKDNGTGRSTKEKIKDLDALIDSKSASSRQQQEYVSLKAKIEAYEDVIDLAEGMID